MHPVQSPDHADPAAPEASWVMGRSARWQTPEGRALLAQDPLLDDLRELRNWGLGLSLMATLPMVIGAALRGVHALGSLRARRREPRGR